VTDHMHAGDTSVKQPKTQLATCRSQSLRSVQSTNTLRNRLVFGFIFHIQNKNQVLLFCIRILGLLISVLYVNNQRRSLCGPSR